MEMDLVECRSARCARIGQSQLACNMDGVPRLVEAG